MKNAGNKQTLPLTDSTGKTSASGLALGLYLVVETSVPENVTSTVDPCLVTLPMTDRVNHSRQYYDVTIYPKNLSGKPGPEKQVMDAEHGLSCNAAEHGYADVATLSGSDRANYRIFSTVSEVHSTATYYTQYDFLDTLGKGLTYNQQDVKICLYRDKSDAESDYTAATIEAGAVQGTHADAVWNYGSEFFAVTYGDGENGAHTMTVKMTRAGLAEINQPVDSADQEGKYSGWTMVIYYSATVNHNETMTYGDSGNPNDVKLTWSRTTDEYSDTLTDTARVYSYGIDLDTSYTPGDLCGTLSASAKVDGDSVDMEATGNSANALVPFTVLNTRGFDLPKTGGPGTTITTVCGVLLPGAVGVAAFLTRKKKRG